MIKRKVKTKRKNPDLESDAEKIISQFGKNIKSKYLAYGYFSEIYYFEIKTSGKLKPGKYVLKIFNKYQDVVDSDVINYLLKLSDNKLIPEIYYITDKYIIMKYIEGVTLKSITKINTINDWIIESNLYTFNDLNNILLNVVKLLKKWHRLGFAHGDLHSDNIMISKGNVYLIDPKIEDMEYISKNHDVRMFKDLYDGVNYTIPESVNDTKIKRLFS